MIWQQHIVLVHGASTIDIEEGYGDAGRLARNEIIANSLLMLSGGINTSSRSKKFCVPSFLFLLGHSLIT